MRTITLTILFASLSLAACGKDDKAGGTEGAPVASKTAAAPADYSAIDKMVDAAKTGDDFTNVLMACGKLEIDAAASGNGELAKDPTYREHCRRRTTHTRAQLAISESTPDKMSAHCLAASMGLEELVKEDIQAAESKDLLAKVNTACGM